MYQKVPGCGEAIYRTALKDSDMRWFTVVGEPFPNYRLHVLSLNCEVVIPSDFHGMDITHRLAVGCSSEGTGVVS